MEIILRKYGNSIVAVLPPTVLRDLHLEVGQPMALEADTTNRSIVLKPKRIHTLASMIAQCDLSAKSPADLAAWDSAAPVGQEVW